MIAHQMQYDTPQHYDSCEMLMFEAMVQVITQSGDERLTKLLGH